jgi:hypothetical protein
LFETYLFIFAGRFNKIDRQIFRNKIKEAENRAWGMEES